MYVLISHWDLVCDKNSMQTAQFDVVPGKYLPYLQKIYAATKSRSFTCTHIDHR